jgi:hypothetical protein
MKRNLSRASTGFLAVAIAAALLGCGDGPDGDGAPTRTVADAGDYAVPASGIEQIEYYVDRATAAGHPKICQEVDREDVRFQCLAILAGRLKDASLCDDIPSTLEETRKLRDVCLSNVAMVLDQDALCERIFTADLRERCRLEVAATPPDPTSTL